MDSYSCMFTKQRFNFYSNCTEKETNFKAGLGPKKICFSTNDTESEVMAKISSDAIDEKSENLGIPQLQTCGGFELLKCRQNCRDLTVIDCK